MKNFLVLVIMAFVAVSVNAYSLSNDDNTTLAGMREKIVSILSVGASNCVFEDRNFNRLNGKTYACKDNTNHYQYDLTMCSKGTKCSGSICQSDITGGDNTVFNVGSFEGTGPTWSWTDPANKAKGLHAKFTNGDGCMGGLTRTSDVYFTCGTSVVTSGNEVGSCKYEINIQSPDFCISSGGGGGGSSTPAKKKDDGLSGGAIFLIVLMSVSVAYVVIGCIVCWKKYDKRGLEACPHKAFWFALPGLIKDGAVFTWGKLRNLCGSKTITTASGDYESA